jgi:hypothetical protein
MSAKVIKNTSGGSMKIFVSVRNRALASVGSAVFIGLLAVPLAIAFSPDALAEGADSKVAVLSVSGPDTFDATLSSSVNKQGKTVQQATVRPVIINSGTADTAIAFHASLDDASGSCALSMKDIAVTTDQKAPLVLRAGGSSAPAVTMIMPTSCAGSSGTLIVTGATGVAPVTLRFTLGRDIGELVYWYPVMFSLIAAALYVIAMLLVIHFGRGKFGHLRDAVATGSGWSFSDSWLTNFAAVGAILGTVLSASGFLPDILPGVSTWRFVGLSLLFGAFVTVAPVIYSAANKWEWSKKDGSPDTLVAVGRVCGVILAAGATVAGVFGELGTLLTLTAEAAGGRNVKILIYTLLAVAALIVAFYAVSFVLEVSRTEKLAKKGEEQSKRGNRGPAAPVELGRALGGRSQAASRTSGEARDGQDAAALREDREERDDRVEAVPEDAGRYISAFRPVSGTL